MAPGRPGVPLTRNRTTVPHAVSLPKTFLNPSKCGYRASTKAQPCTHTHDDTCGYVPNDTPCQHVHDDACGYQETDPGHPCGFVCSVCAPTDTLDAQHQTVSISSIVVLDANADLAALNDPLQYVDADGNEVTIESGTIVTILPTETTEWAAGWYYVPPEVTEIQGPITIDASDAAAGDVHLVLGGNLTIKGGIQLKGT